MFKYNLTIEGSESELHTIEKGLLKLGYKRSVYTFYVDRSALITGNSSFAYTCSINSGVYRIKVSAKDENLVYALASMKDNGVFYQGEFIYLRDNTITYITKVYLDLVDTKHSGILSKKDVRKATAEEIITYFNKKKMDNKIIAYYLCIKEIPFNKEYKLNARYGNINESLSQYPEYFEAVYKEHIREVAINIKNYGATPYDLAPLIVIMDSAGKISCPSRWKEFLSVDILKAYIVKTTSIDTIPIYPENIHFGCKGGPTIAYEDIKTVIQKWDEVFGKEK